MNLRKLIIALIVFPVAIISLPGCNGLFDGVYDNPPADEPETVAGQLYIDASDWTKWHYIDLHVLADSVSANPSFNTSSLWDTRDIPLKATGQTVETDASEELPGIYTYWYDVYGAGVDHYEFRSFYPTEGQSEPEEWTLAVHRNNVRTNGGAVAATAFNSFEELPEDRSFYAGLDFKPDTWNQSDVWTVQDRMLLGIIGNQGISVNTVLSSWLTMDIPPMPPAFTHNGKVFILRLSDGSMAAIQLQNYLSSTGTKCCLTINYRYPL